jgi:hypothetical protein
MLDTPADEDATYQMWWPVFECGNTQNQYIEAYRSRGGKSVAVINHKIDRWGSRHCSTPKTMVRIEGATAGGRFWSLCDHARSSNVNNTNTYHANYRHILISGTREPLAAIGFCVETRPTGSTAPGAPPITITSSAGPLAVLDDCQNVIIGGYKQEQDGMTTGLTRALNCQNLLMTMSHGHLGTNRLMLMEGSTQIEMDQLCHQRGSSTSLAFMPIVDFVGYTQTVEEAMRPEYIGYLRVGSAVNMSVFPTDWGAVIPAPAVLRPVAAPVTQVHVVLWAETNAATAALRALEIISGGANIATVTGNLSDDGSVTNRNNLIDGSGATDATFSDIARLTYDMSGSPAVIESVVLRSSNTLPPPLRGQVWVEVSGLPQKLLISDFDMRGMSPSSPLSIDVLSQTLWVPWTILAADKVRAA